MPKKKAVSNTERQRKFRERIKANSEKHQEYLASERRRWQERKKAKKIKSVADMSSRELRHKRKEWCTKKRMQRQKQKADQELQVPSPPMTPLHTELYSTPISSTQSSLGRKRVRRDRSKLYRQVQKLNTELANAVKMAQRYKKRYQRLLSSTRGSNDSKISPRKVTKQMLVGCRVSRHVKRSLLCYNSMIRSIKEKYSGTQAKKQMIRDLFVNQLMRKYKLKKEISKKMGFEYRQRNLRTGRNKYQGVAFRLGANVRIFLEQDSSSRITTGKRDTVTKYGNKRQRRVLLDSLENLHAKYCEENVPMSYSLFCKLRPFHIVHPTARDRETCLCKIHENMQLMILKLHQLQLLPSSCKTVEKCVDAVCCPGRQEDCCYRQCKVCQHKALLNPVSDDSIETCWWEWSISVNNVSVRGEMKKVRKTVKIRRSGTTKELCENFMHLLTGQVCAHVWRIWKQYTAFQTVKRYADSQVAVVVVDFSENYNCKYGRETHSTHFGASQTQATLHTGVAYICNKPVSFCSVSPSYLHGPAAIWAHILPVLKHLKLEHPYLTTLSMWSDGPTTQYRNKHNFLLFNHLTRTLFQHANWNMFEAGHGKSAADAVGGVIKRMADDTVKMGSDIPDAITLFNALKDKTAVKMFFIEEVSINDIGKMIPTNAKAITGTMQLHQVIRGESDESLIVRNISCFCKLRCTTVCACFNPKQVTVGPLTVSLTEQPSHQPVGTAADLQPHKSCQRKEFKKLAKTQPHAKQQPAKKRRISYNSRMITYPRSASAPRISIRKPKWLQIMSDEQSAGVVIQSPATEQSAGVIKSASTSLATLSCSATAATVTSSAADGIANTAPSVVGDMPSSEISSAADGVTNTAPSAAADQDVSLLTGDDFHAADLTDEPLPAPSTAFEDMPSSEMSSAADGVTNTAPSAVQDVSLPTFRVVHPELKEAQAILAELSPRPKLKSVRPRTRKAESAAIITSSPYKQSLMDKMAASKPGSKIGSKSKRTSDSQASKTKTKLPGTKRIKQETKKTKKKAQQETDETPCCICCRKYNEPPFEDWIACGTCGKWYHESCGPDDEAVCYNCVA